MSQRKYTVSAVARLVGVSTDSVRYYERIGILPQAARSPAGYRQWDQREIHYVKWIGPAKRAGFTLSELAEIFRTYRAGIPPCRNVRDLLTKKMVNLENQILELSAARRELKRVLARWDDRLRHAAPSEFIPLLDDLRMLRASLSRNQYRRLAQGGGKS